MSGDLGPLPGGRHGLSQKQVTESQRERLLAAVATLAAERGFGGATIAEIAKAASVSNRVFYENFRDKEEAFIVAFDSVADHVRVLISDATAAAEDEWSSQWVAALSTTLEFFDEEPALARFCLVAPFTAPPRVVTHCREMIGGAAPYLAKGRRPEDAPGLPDSTEDSLIGGVIAQLSRSIVNQGGPLIALLPDLIEFGLSPYLGTNAARSVAESAG